VRREEEGHPLVIVAIDGPAGSGKSTVARALARRLGFAYLDTGAMYRAVTWLALTHEVPLDDAAGLDRIARGARIDFERTPGEPLATRVLADGHDVTDAIRTPEVDAAVSAVASQPAVRDAMVAQQRAAAAHAVDCVVEGRDIGTVVFPDAELKVYLTASAEERARRRHEEQRDAGLGVQADEVLASMRRRDRLDSTRAASPLAAAEDAVVVDTTGMTPDAVVEHVAAMAKERR
jgi:cytidylate kinase